MESKLKQDPNEKSIQIEIESNWKIILNWNWTQIENQFNYKMNPNEIYYQPDTTSNWKINLIQRENWSKLKLEWKTKKWIYIEIRSK